MPPVGFELTRRAAAHQRLIPRGHWDRLICTLIQINFRYAFTHYLIERLVLDLIFRFILLHTDL